MPMSIQAVRPIASAQRVISLIMVFTVVSRVFDEVSDSAVRLLNQCG